MSEYSELLQRIIQLEKRVEKLEIAEDNFSENVKLAIIKALDDDGVNNDSTYEF